MEPATYAAKNPTLSVAVRLHLVSHFGMFLVCCSPFGLGFSFPFNTQPNSYLLSGPAHCWSHDNTTGPEKGDNKRTKSPGFALQGLERPALVSV
eukprot:1720147-Prymnesium_polylepis.1